MGQGLGMAYEGYVSWRVIEMDCREDDVCDGDVGLCYNGKDGTRGAIWIMLRLVVYNDSRRGKRWYGRHLS